MATTGQPSATSQKGRVAQVLKQIGSCLELVPMDARFRNISVGLYVKDGVCTIWSFSRVDGVDERLRVIRDQMVRLGDLRPVDGTHNQLTFPCGQVHVRPVKFLLTQAVVKEPDFTHPAGDMRIKDSKSPLTLCVDGHEQGGRWLYQVSAEGEAPNPALRLRMVVAGFMRYGEMEKADETEVAFPCGHRHDGLMRVLLPYSRNISAVETMREAEALRGQMTTNTLGFTPL